MPPLLPCVASEKEPVATTAAFADAQQIQDEGEEQWRQIDTKDEKQIERLVEPTTEEAEEMLTRQAAAAAVRRSSAAVVRASSHSFVCASVTRRRCGWSPKGGHRDPPPGRARRGQSPRNYHCGPPLGDALHWSCGRPRGWTTRGHHCNPPPGYARQPSWTTFAMPCPADGRREGTYACGRGALFRLRGVRRGRR
jgi:hypothetical protein